MLFVCFEYSCMHVQAYVLNCLYMCAYTGTCVLEYTCVCVYVYICVCGYVFVCVQLYASACFCLLVSRIVICQSCVTSNVQRGGVYKYFSSASTFSHSICDIIDPMNYNALLPLFGLLISLQFISHYNSFDLPDITWFTANYVDDWITVNYVNYWFTVNYVNDWLLFILLTSWSGIQVEFIEWNS